METANVKQVIQLFNTLSTTEQLEVAEKISEQTFEKRWQLLDSDLPDTEISEDDIVNEVRAVRYGEKN